MLWLLSLSALADCPPAQPAAALEPPLARAEKAVASLDSGALEHALEDASDVFSCLAEVPATATVSRYFGLTGVAAYVAGRTEEALDAFAVPRRTGAWVLPADISGPMRQIWETADPAADDAPRPLAAVDPGRWAVDGVVTTSSPTTRPYLLQRLDEAGAPVSSWLVATGELPPAAVATPGPQPAPRPLVSETAVAEPSQRRTSRTLLLSGIGAAALGAGAAAGAAVLDQSYRDSTRPDAELGGLKTANHALGWGAVGLFVAGGGLGTSAVLVGRW